MAELALLQRPRDQPEVPAGLGPDGRHPVDKHARQHRLHLPVHAIQHWADENAL